MESRVIIYFILTGLLALNISISKAQDDKHIISGDQMVAEQPDIQFETLGFLRFPKLNTEGYYYNEKALKKIQKLDDQGDLEALLVELEDYVNLFGIENFKANSELAWRLGQLYEIFGQEDKAKSLYSLVLKHSDVQTPYIQKYYADNGIAERDLFVPIEYYYELVEFRKKVDTLRPPRGVFLNMGGSINSAYEDYGPALNISNGVLLFGSKRNRTTAWDMSTADINEDIYMSTKQGNGWSMAKPLKGINTSFNEGAPCLSRDGMKLYFVRCETPDGNGSCDIYVAELVGDNLWGNIKNLGADVNSKYWDSHPSLSHTEDTLYFVSDRNGGFGANDIYYTYKNKKGEWSPAKNLGPMINTRFDEVSPFYHPIHHVMYFSSNGQILNFGGFDIYKSRLIDGRWSEPTNIGPLVNGGGDEHFFTIDSESKDLYYARSIEGQEMNLDLYSFPLPMGGQPLAYTKFTGTLTDSVTGKPFEGIVSVIDMENGIEVAPKYLNDDGSFEFDLINDNKYLLVIQGEDFFRIEQEIDLQGDTSLQIKTPSINFYRLQFASIEFASNSSKILPHMEQDLNKLLDYILDNPSMKLQISGHTDQVGDPLYNRELSQARANAIKDYLVDKGGIDPERITAIGYGSQMPIIKEEKTEEDRRINRRVEFEILMEEGESDPGELGWK